MVVMALVSLLGCASIDTSIDNLAESLNKRQVHSCLYLSGMYKVFVSARALIATGGIPIERCMGEAATVWPTPIAAPPVKPTCPEGCP
jgi:hypothetical protein